MKTHTARPRVRRQTSLRRVGLLVGAAAVVAAMALTATGRAGPGMPVAGSGMAPPHTTYQQPVVDPINLGATTTPPSPLPAEPVPPPAELAG